MTNFTGDTILKRISEREYSLESELTYENEKYKITCLPGFITDGASIPRIFWTLIGCPFTGKYIGSAIMHDLLIKTHLLSKDETSDLFLEMLKDNGVSLVKRKVMYIFVKAYSKLTWYDQDTKELHDNRKFSKFLLKS